MHLYLTWLWGSIAVLNVISFAMAPSLTQFNLVLAQSAACMFALRIYRNEERPY